MEPRWDGGKKVCSRGLGHMTKMAATPIYGKDASKIFFSRTKGNDQDLMQTNSRLTKRERNTNAKDGIKEHKRKAKCTALSQ